MLIWQTPCSLELAIFSEHWSSLWKTNRQVWWHRPLIPAWEDASLVYRGSSRTARAIQETLSWKTMNKCKKNYIWVLGCCWHRVLSVPLTSSSFESTRQLALCHQHRDTRSTLKSQPHPDFSPRRDWSWDMVRTLLFGSIPRACMSSFSDQTAGSFEEWPPLTVRWFVVTAGVSLPWYPPESFPYGPLRATRTVCSNIKSHAFLLGSLVCLMLCEAGPLLTFDDAYIIPKKLFYF